MPHCVIAGGGGYQLEKNFTSDVTGGRRRRPYDGGTDPGSARTEAGRVHAAYHGQLAFEGSADGTTRVGAQKDCVSGTQ